MLRPAVRGARVQVYRGSTYVTSARVGANGRFRARVLLRSPGTYRARYGAARSGGRTITLRPQLHARLPAIAAVGAALTFRPTLVPARAGSVRVRVFRDGRVVRNRAGRIPTGAPGAIRVELTTVPRGGYAGVRRVLNAQVVQPSLALGARGPSVLALERRLAELRYALRGVDGVYDQDTYEAVLAFQKVNGLPRTGRVEAWLWRRLARAGIPRAQRGGDYIEVDKTRQVLFVVERRPRGAGRARLHRRDRQHTARQLAGLPQGSRLGLGALVPDVLQGRLCDPRLSVRPRLSRVARLRPDPDVDRAYAVRQARPGHHRGRSSLMAGPDSTDPLIRQLREQLSDNDVAIVEAVNARLKLVARLKRVKEERGIDFLDPAREEWMLQYLTRANRGPLSADGLREIYTELLDLTKREVARGEES